MKELDEKILIPLFYKFIVCGILPSVFVILGTDGICDTAGVRKIFNCRRLSEERPV